MVEKLKELMRVRANLNNQAVGEPPTTPHDWMAWEESCADFLRDHGQALVEALADAERYQFVRRKEAWREVQDNPHHGSISAIYVGRGDHGGGVAMDTEELDKAIDKAIINSEANP